MLRAPLSSAAPSAAVADAAADAVAGFHAGQTLDQSVRRVLRTLAGPTVVAAAFACIRRDASELLRLESRAAEHATTPPAGGTDAKHRRKCPGCPACDAWREQCAEIDARLDVKFAEEIGAALARYASQLRVQWTAELLATTFAVGDGERPTYGEATLDQHRRCVEMLLGNAVGNLETAAYHKVAIDLITATGADTLAEALALGAVAS